MSDAPGFANLVPGFDFLQGLVKNAGAAIPGIGQWVAPTLDPDELGKRIEELRTVKFWLEQNAQLIETTIQALEVQRMTLSTLKSMNVQMGDLRESMQVRVPDPAPPAAAASAEPAARAPRQSRRQKARHEGSGPGLSSAAPSGPIDPMQWWTALTRQFTEIAASAVRQTQAEQTASADEPAPKVPSPAATDRAPPAPPRRPKSGGKQTKGEQRRRARATAAKPADA